MTLDLRKIIAKAFGTLEEMENAVCEQEERLRDMTAEVMAWRAWDTIDRKMMGGGSEAISEARRLRTQNEKLYP